MALLDFIRNRSQQSVEQPQQKTETYQQAMRREAEQEKAKPANLGITPEQEGILKEAQAKWNSVVPPPETSQAPSPTPADATSNPQPMAQKMEQQDKAAPALSPTTMQTGARESEQHSAPSIESPAKTPGTSPERSQTHSRPSPSWER